MYEYTIYIELRARKSYCAQSLKNKIKTFEKHVFIYLCLSMVHLNYFVFNRYILKGFIFLNTPGQWVIK